jgi:23S rRNA (cytosine1962-C5)-methyltransferase
MEDIHSAPERRAIAPAIMVAPRASQHEPQVEIDPKAARSVLRGSPWVWKQSVRRAARELTAGTPVLVRAEGADFIGRGLWDPVSAIAARIYVRDRAERLDAEALARGLHRAFSRRDGMFELQHTSAFRLCNGEGDRVPAVVVDRYAHVAVVRWDGEAIRAWAEPLLAAIGQQLRDRGVQSEMVREPAQGGVQARTVSGPAVAELVEVVEHDMRLLVDLHRGQKTGAFLDQRESRRRVRAMANGARVLNLFSYTAGFSLAAALGGAQHVTSVDSAQPAHATAQRIFERNGLDPSRHGFVTADVFSFLQRAAQRGERWDLVISDPPSFAPNERSVGKAQGAYRKLHAACAQVLSPGGTLCACSCSSHLGAEAFLQTLDDETLGAGRFVVGEVHGQPSDHPSLPAWPEGRYLKFVVLRGA